MPPYSSIAIAASAAAVASADRRNSAAKRRQCNHARTNRFVLELALLVLLVRRLYDACPALSSSTCTGHYGKRTLSPDCSTSLGTGASFFAYAWTPYQSDYVDDGDDIDGYQLPSNRTEEQSAYRDIASQPGNADDLPSLFETVDEYRSRMNIQYKYKAEYISDELCKYVNEDECRQMDQTFHTNAVHTRTVAKANDGKIRVLTILVRWKDEQKQPLEKSGFETLWNGEGFSEQNSGPIPTGSVRRYIDLNSYGNVIVHSDVIDWVTTNGTEEYYASLPHIHKTEPDMRGAWHYVLEQLDRDGFDFSPYDVDQDGYLDVVVFMHSGYGSENGSDRCPEEAKPGEAPPNGFKKRIPSHATPGESHKVWTSSDGRYRMGNYAINTAYRGECTGNLARLNVLTHEFLHTFGLPDMYGHCGVWSGLGAYDIMAKSNGVTGRPAWPPMMGPWSKYQLGWSEPTEITADGTYRARPSAYFDDIFVIRMGYQQNEYLLLENRMPAEWEKDLWNHGILIYHVDENRRKDGGLIGWGRFDRGFPNLPGAEWPGSGQHYKVALLAADGRYDLEKCKGHGGADDFYYRPDQVLGPGNGELVATEDGTYPNTDSYAFGDIQVTGITISNFRREGSSDAFLFDVSGLDAMSENRASLSPTKAPTNRPEPATTEPTLYPTVEASASPSLRPTSAPTNVPTDDPTFVPSSVPSHFPTPMPSRRPSSQPSGHPTSYPSDLPTSGPTSTPTGLPTNIRSSLQSVEPTSVPTPIVESAAPTLADTVEFNSPVDITEDGGDGSTGQPTNETASDVPSMVISSVPSQAPSVNGTATMQPTTSSNQPSTWPTAVPSLRPTEVVSVGENTTGSTLSSSVLSFPRVLMTTSGTVVAVAIMLIL